MRIRTFVRGINIEYFQLSEIIGHIEIDSLEGVNHNVWVQKLVNIIEYRD